MARLALSLVTGLLGAVALHIIVLFLVPRYSEHDIWSLMSERADVFSVVNLSEPAPDQPALWSADPLLRGAGCRFDLTDGMAHVTALAAPRFWSMSVYDRHGLNLFSINDKTADANVDIVLATPFQAIELRKAVPDDLAGAIIVEVPEDEGLAVLRTFQPDWTYRPDVDGFLTGIQCRPL